MQEFPANSQKAKARSEAPLVDERPKINPITSAEAVQRKPGLGRKFKKTFIGGNARDAADHVIIDVIIPTVRDMMFDAFESGLQRFIYGESRGRTRAGQAPSAYGAVGKVNYQGMSQPKPMMPQQRMLSNQARAQHNFNDILIDSRREADDVLEQLYEFLSRFGVVRIADLYALTNIQSSHVDHKWGWTSLHGSKLGRTRDGRFTINLPEPIPLD